MNSNDNKNKIYVPYATRTEAILYVALACLNIALVAILGFATDIYFIFLALGFALIYLIEVSVIRYVIGRSAPYIPSKSIQQMLEESCSAVIKDTQMPSLAIDNHGRILWYNKAMAEILTPDENFVGRNASDILNTDINKGVHADKVTRVSIGNSIYNLEGFVVSEEGDGVYLAVFNDITELSETRKKYVEEKVAIAYIAIDNAEEVSQYIHEKFSDIVYIVEDKLKTWAASMNGVIKSYDNNKYIMFFDSKGLQQCRENKFSILDEVRMTRVGDGVSITISIGVSCSGKSLEERDAIAKDAIDMAIERGGDQAVDKSNNGPTYYGGRTKTIYKRSSVLSRSIASRLTSLMARSDNVIVMGHRYGDFDSFGSAIGIARLAMLGGAKVNIAVDLRDKNLAPCVELMQKTEAYSRVFVDNADGLDLISSDTLVVLVDHSSLGRSQFADISKKAKTIAIIDHHRKAEELPDTVKIEYIVPNASSTCEIVTEMIESSVNSQCLLKEEADMLLSGILLDTKQFTRNTGTRTFAAAQYLQGAGANPTDVYNLFKTAADDLAKEARFHTAITMYRENVAIASCDGETDDTYRIIASKAADKMLTLRGIDAAFAIVRIGENIHISGRSNGKINVQLVLEKLHGGGHFEVAGAQVSGMSVDEVLTLLKDSIDEYCDSNTDMDDSEEN